MPEKRDPICSLFRKVKFWVRAIPRRGVGKPTQIYHKIYRNQKAAKAASKRGDVQIQVTGFYPTAQGKESAP